MIPNKSAENTASETCRFFNGRPVTRPNDASAVTQEPGFEGKVSPAELCDFMPSRQIITSYFDIICHVGKQDVFKRFT